MYLISLTYPSCSYSILLISDRPISTRILSLIFIQYINVYSVFLSQLSYRRFLHTFLSPLKSSSACFSIYFLFCLFTIVYNMFSLSLYFLHSARPNSTQILSLILTEFLCLILLIIIYINNVHCVFSFFIFILIDIVRYKS